jgi:hypothetical protein
MADNPLNALTQELLGPPKVRAVGIDALLLTLLLCVSTCLPACRAKQLEDYQPSLNGDALLGS